ncbi:MAG: ATP-binding cassette domain-containing protein [Desulfobacteraceae bacterium]|jgi:simple sugar transport system ATP-binding protein
MELELKRISKHFGDLRANDGVDLTVQPGSIHAVLGENGAGKSTLMKIAAGYLRRTSGEIRIDGRRVDFRSPADAAAHGIGMLYQDPLDFAHLSVLENFMLGQIRGLRCAPSVFRQSLDNLCRQLGFKLDPNSPVALLTVGERQQLEMLRLLSLGIRLLILDEPTTGISAVQKEVLFKALKQLARQGKSVLLVSHKLGDVEELCDELTVLRKGRVTGSQRTPFDTGTLMGMMFEELTCPPARNGSKKGEIVLEMSGVTGSGGRTGLQECSTRIAEGEVVGLAGLEGSGQGVFLKIAAGLTAPAQGSVQLASKAMTGKDHRGFLARGVGYLPSARLDEGLMPGLSMIEHAALKTPGSPFFIQWSDSARAARNKIAEFRIAGRPDSTVETLSGGNQQRLMLSFLPLSPKLLLLENPTRGLDLESAAWVWNHLLSYNRQGAAIVFSSSELDEILGVADRILVFFEGRIIADLAADQSDSQRLGHAIAGKA